jgi:nitrogen PTS system EIIA component
MQITVREASALLKLPEKTIYRFIKRNEIPSYRLNKSFFFNKAELLEWAISRSIDIAPEFFSSADQDQGALPLLADALKNGGIHRITGGSTKTDVLQNIVALIPDTSSSDKNQIFKALLTRESLGSTAIGNGIAIPHARNPIILNIKGPSILLCFLENPVDFDAVDGKKVATIFTMISPTARVHLHLLARLSYLLQDDGLRALISPATEPALLHGKIREAEERMAPKGAVTGKGRG